MPTATMIQPRQVIGRANVQADYNAKEQRIKGFVSVERYDRQGEIASPLEFNYKTFLSGSAPVYVNHKKWKDEYGNETSVGRFSTLFPAEIVDIGEDENWGIKNLDDGDIIESYPKAKVPELIPGDRGLFGSAVISNKKIAEKINAGELAEFSWRGRNYTSKSEPSRLKQIDLVEISVVTAPQNRHSTFIALKCISDITFDASIFDAQKVVDFAFNNDYLEFEVSSDKGTLHLQDKDNLGSPVDTLKSEDGVTFILTDLVKSDKPSANKSGERSMNDSENTKEESAKSDASQNTDNSESNTNKDTSEQKQITLKSDEAIAFADYLSEQMWKSIAHHVEEMIKDLSSQVNLLKDICSRGMSMGTTGEKSSTDLPVESTETQKSETDSTKKLDELASETTVVEETQKSEEVKNETQDDATKQVESLKSILDDGFSKIAVILERQQNDLKTLNDRITKLAKAPAGEHLREERQKSEVETQKSPNSVFDSLFSRHFPTK